MSAERQNTTPIQTNDELLNTLLNLTEDNNRPQVLPPPDTPPQRPDSRRVTAPPAPPPEPQRRPQTPPPHEHTFTPPKEVIDAVSAADARRMLAEERATHWNTLMKNAALHDYAKAWQKNNEVRVNNQLPPLELPVHVTQADRRVRELYTGPEGWRTILPRFGGRLRLQRSILPTRGLARAIGDERIRATTENANRLRRQFGLPQINYQHEALQAEIQRTNDQIREAQRIQRNANPIDPRRIRIDAHIRDLHGRRNKLMLIQDPNARTQITDTQGRTMDRVPELTTAETRRQQAEQTIQQNPRHIVVNRFRRWVAERDVNNVRKRYGLPTLTDERNIAEAQRLRQRADQIESIRGRRWWNPLSFWRAMRQSKADRVRKHAQEREARVI